jgi:FAD/FMN-containing dehydrogenase
LPLEAPDTPLADDARVAPADGDLHRELAEGIGTPIMETPEEVAPYTRDFCGVREGRPTAVVRATAEAEVAHALRVARRRGVPAVMRGAGHTCNGQTLTDGGLVIRSFEDSVDLRFDAETGFADVSARSPWSELQKHLTARGRACPVLTDYLSLSVGGTLSVGGYGARSIANGAQIDNVLRLRLVLPSGQTVECSAGEKDNLFRFALAGQGAAGAIERVVMRTMAHRPRARFYAYEHAGLEELAESLAWLETWDGPAPDLFVGARRLRPGPEFTVSQYGFDLDPSLPLDPCALTPLSARTPSWVRIIEDHERMSHARTVALIDDHPGCVRLWADYMLSHKGFVEFARHVDERLTQSRFRAYLTVVGLLIHRSPADKIDFPFEVSRSSLGQHKYMVGFYFFVPRSESREIEFVRKALGELLERALSLGGRPYRYSFTELSDAHKRALYGASDDELSEALTRSMEG